MICGTLCRNGLPQKSQHRLNSFADGVCEIQNSVPCQKEQSEIAEDTHLGGRLAPLRLNAQSRSVLDQRCAARFLAYGQSTNDRDLLVVPASVRVFTPAQDEIITFLRNI